MRRRVWIWACAVPLALAAVAGLIVWDTHRRADAALVRNAEEARERLAAFQARGAERPPFDPPGVDGNAWEVYRKVIGPLSSLPADEQETVDADSLGLPIDDEALGVVFLKVEPLILGLREGLNRKSVDPDVLGPGKVFADISPALNSAKVLGAGVAHLHRMRQDARALEWSAYGLAFAQDVGRRSCVLGLLVRDVLEGIFVGNLTLVLNQHGLSGAQLEAFARRLDVLDAARPTLEEAWESEEIYMRGTLSGDAWAADAASPDLAGWRDLGSLKVARARALEELARLFEEGRGVMRRPTHERAAEAERLRTHWERSENKIVSTAGPGLFKVFNKDVVALQSRTMLRLALAVAWYEAEKGTFPATLAELAPRYVARVPPDPATGRPFGYARVAGELWAAGPDGVDNNGAPDLTRPDDPRPGFDILLSVGRRK